MGVGGEPTILQRTISGGLLAMRGVSILSFPLDNQKEERMLLLIARGKDLHAGQAERSRSGHAGYAHPKNVGSGTYPWIWDFRPNRADEQRCFSLECGLVISCHSTVREGWANRRRVEADRE